MAKKRMMTKREGSETVNPHEIDDGKNKSPWSAEKLKLSSNMWPTYTDKFLDDIISDIKHRVNDMKTANIKSNLTQREHNGLIWCKAQAGVYIAC